MERIYRSLMWAAIIAVVSGAILTGWVVWITYNQINFISFAHSVLALTPPDAWSLYFSFEFPSLLQSAAFEFLLGVAILATVVAWADRRNSWLVALATLTLVTLIAPYFLTINNPLFELHPRLSQFLQNYGLQVDCFSRILPCVLAIIMARTNPPWDTSRQRTRSLADAELEITRSSL